jgi:hypothetical protein
MSPSLLSKYLEAARSVADHIVLRPDGIFFAPHPMLVETDREKYSVDRILAFYNRQPTDFADYFQAAWRYKHRVVFGRAKATLAEVAAEMKVSPKYLPMIWQFGAEQGSRSGFQAEAMWRQLRCRAEPAGITREGCVQMRDFVVNPKHSQMMFPPTPAGIRLVGVAAHCFRYVEAAWSRVRIETLTGRYVWVSRPGESW